MAECVNQSWNDFHVEYMKDSSQHEGNGLYDLSENVFGSDHSTDESFPFSGTASCEYSSACPTPNPEMAPARIMPQPMMQCVTEIYCGDVRSNVPASAAISSRESFVPPPSSVSESCKVEPASGMEDKNPYAKPRMTFRSGITSPRSTRPNPPAQGGIQTTSAHQLATPCCSAASRPRSKPLPRPPVPGKQQKLCYYDLCPSPMQSNKWRTVTEGTAAGGQTWDALVGKMLCDSCYSTFRKHGTLVRSVRTPEGWARLDGDGTVYRPNQPKNNRKRASSSSDSARHRKKASSAQVQKAAQASPPASIPTEKTASPRLMEQMKESMAESRAFIFPDDGMHTNYAPPAVQTQMHMESMGAVPHWYHNSAAFLHADNIAAC